jgi:hypothetical protein
MAIISQNQVRHSQLYRRGVITAKAALNLNTVLKKQSQFSAPRMDVSVCYTKRYANSNDWARGENEPIQSQWLVFGLQHEALHRESEGRDPKILNKHDCSSAIMQNKANFHDARMNVTSGLSMNYDALAALRRRGNTAKQTQFQSRSEGIGRADRVRLTFRRFSAILGGSEIYREKPVCS